ncbi:glycosyl transferase [Echinicola pacifica]|uniref:Glycosyl transferase n=1 Tax=Echinicola pacifica TaxID=346377 RepID=A0A918PK63_9BACT|nr:glycosyltransferase family 2 protein [Echinicola pacifica]GGZ13831.1 glycosyl transferase [Echinicola pacifica]
MDKVSIIIPTFNYGFVINESLDSVLEQTHQNWECIIVDDGSTDNTKEVINKYLKKDGRFNYFYQKNSGVSTARNKGISLATGDFIQFLDGDDLLSREKLCHQIHHFNSNPDIDISYTNNFYFRNGNKDKLSFDSEMKGKEWMYKLHGRGTDTLSAIIHHNIAVMSSPLIRASILKKDIRFPDGIDLLEDWIFWLKLAFTNASFHYLNHPKAFTLNRLHPTSVTKNNLIKMKEGDIQLRSQLAKMIYASPINDQEKKELYAINNKYYKWNFKKLIYQIGPWNFKEINRVKHYVNPIIFTKYYIKTIYRHFTKISNND